VASQANGRLSISPAAPDLRLGGWAGDRRTPYAVLHFTGCL